MGDIKVNYDARWSIVSVQWTKWFERRIQDFPLCLKIS